MLKKPATYKRKFLQTLISALFIITSYALLFTVTVTATEDLFYVNSDFTNAANVQYYQGWRIFHGDYITFENVDGNDAVKFAGDFGSGSQIIYQVNDFITMPYQYAPTVLEFDVKIYGEPEDVILGELRIMDGPMMSGADTSISHLASISRNVTDGKYYITLNQSLNELGNRVSRLLTEITRDEWHNFRLEFNTGYPREYTAAYLDGIRIFKTVDGTPVKGLGLYDKWGELGTAGKRFSMTHRAGSGSDMFIAMDNFKLYKPGIPIATLMYPQQENQILSGTEEISISFSNTMNKDIFNNTTVIIQNSQTGELQYYSDFIYDENIRTLSIPISQAPFTGGTLYNIMLGSGVADIFGQQAVPALLGSFSIDDYGLELVRSLFYKGSPGSREQLNNIQDGMIWSEAVLKNFGNDTVDATVMHVLYKEGKLENIYRTSAQIYGGSDAKLSAGFLIPTEDSNQYTVKVLFWDNLETMRPLSKSYSINESGIN